MNWLPLGTALWLGILTAISPCPMATNIAAISFIGRRSTVRRAVLLAGLGYTLGRILAYVLLGMLLMTGLLAQAEISQFLQRYMNLILGPILLLLGMILLGWIGATLSLNLAGDKVQRRVEQSGLLGSVMLGILFALSFCPISAGLFFMGLIPLAIEHESRLVLPLLYALGTALPVVIFAFLLTFAATSVAQAFNKLTVIEHWIRIATGGLFILAGSYLCLSHVYGLQLF